MTDGEEALTEEQEALDNHDDQVSELDVRIQRLVSSLTPSPVPDIQRLSLRRLTHLKEKLAGISTSIDTVTDDDDGVCTLQQHGEQIADLKKELKEIQNALLDVDLEAGDPLVKIKDTIERAIFEGSCQ